VPLKSSLNTVDQPDGGPGTAATWAGVTGAAGAAKAEEDDAAAPVSAMTGATMATARTPLGRHLVARLHLRMTRSDMPGMPGLLNPLRGFWIGKKLSYCKWNVTVRFRRVNQDGR